MINFTFVFVSISMWINLPSQSLDSSNLLGCLVYFGLDGGSRGLSIRCTICKAKNETNYKKMFDYSTVSSKLTYKRTQSDKFQSASSSN